MDHFCYLCFVFVTLSCLLQSCGHLLGKGYLLALLCVVFSCVLSLSHVLSWVRCGTCFYGFRIFASLLTLFLVDVSLFNIKVKPCFKCFSS